MDDDLPKFPTPAQIEKALAKAMTNLMEEIYALLDHISFIRDLEGRLTPDEVQKLAHPFLK